MTNEINILQTAIWTILFIVPGYVATETKHYWMMTTPRRPADTTIESLYWSLGTYFILSFFPATIFDLEHFTDTLSNLNAPEKLLFNVEFLRSYSIIVFFALSLGFLYGHFFPVKMMSRYLGRTPYARVWDEFWKLKSVEAANDGVWLELKDGTQWVGKLNSASDTPGNSEIWLTDIRRFFPEKMLLSDSVYSDMLINSENVLRIFVVKEGLLSKPLDQPTKTTYERIKLLIARRFKLRLVNSKPILNQNKENS